MARGELAAQYRAAQAHQRTVDAARKARTGWAVFKWTAANRYPVEARIVPMIYRTEKAAEAAVRRLYGEYVNDVCVRPVDIGAPQTPSRNPPGRVLSENVLEIRYKHAADGKLYQHDFGPGVRMTLQRDGSVLLRHAQGKKLWDEFDL